MNQLPRHFKTLADGSFQDSFDGSRWTQLESGTPTDLIEEMRRDGRCVTIYVPPDYSMIMLVRMEGQQ